MTALVLAALAAAPAAAEAAACAKGGRVLERVERDSFVLVRQRSLTGSWWMCASGRQRLVGYGRLARLATAGDFAAVTMRRNRTVEVALFNRRVRVLRRARIHADVETPVGRPRVVSLRVDRHGAAAFGLDGGGRRGLYLANKFDVHALDVRHGVDLRSQRFRSGTVVWRHRNTLQRQAVLRRWDATPLGCAVPPNAASAVAGQLSSLYELTRFAVDGQRDHLIGCTGGGPPRGLPVASAPTYQGDVSGHGFETVLKAVVSPHNGRGAFVSDLTIYRLGVPSVTRFLRTFDASGGKPLDTGPGIDPASLRLTGSAVSWTHDGQLRTDPAAVTAEVGLTAMPCAQAAAGRSAGASGSPW